MGVQVKTRFKSGREQAVFVPIDQVQDVQILEGFQRWSLVNVLAVLRKSANHLFVFKVLLHSVVDNLMKAMQPALRLLTIACKEAKAVLAKVKPHVE